MKIISIQNESAICVHVTLKIICEKYVYSTSSTMDHGLWLSNEIYGPLLSWKINVRHFQRGNVSFFPPFLLFFDNHSSASSSASFKQYPLKGSPKKARWVDGRESGKIPNFLGLNLNKPPVWSRNHRRQTYSIKDFYKCIFGASSDLNFVFENLPGYDSDASVLLNNISKMIRYFLELLFDFILRDVVISTSVLA